MKQQINELYLCPIRPELKQHLLHDLGLSKDDQTILESLMTYNGDSNFHYENTGIPKERFERKLRNINMVVIPELIRLSNNQIMTK